MLENTLRELRAKEKIERAFPILLPTKQAASGKDKKLAS